MGSISAIIDTIPIRARAYNDCAESPILLKTRSSGGPGYPRIDVFSAYILTHIYMPIPVV